MTKFFSKSNDLTTTAVYLHAILASPEKLSEALASDPNIFIKHDEDGMTLLHHAALLGTIVGSSTCSTIFNILFKAPNIDFTVTNNRGDTPVHVAADVAGKDRDTCKYVFPAFVQEAANHNFNFNTLSDEKVNVLHIAATSPFIGSRYVNNVYTLLNTLKECGKMALIDVNSLSGSGATAFFYAISHMNLAGAKTLLDFGANPLLFGTSSHDPVGEISKAISAFEKKIKNGNDVNSDTYSVEECKTTLAELREMQNTVDAYRGDINYCRVLRF